MEWAEGCEITKFEIWFSSKANMNEVGFHMLAIFF